MQKYNYYHYSHYFLFHKILDCYHYKNCSDKHCTYYKNNRIDKDISQSARRLKPQHSPGFVSHFRKSRPLQYFGNKKSKCKKVFCPLI